MQVGAFHPNLLASYSIFAAAVVAAPQSALPTRLRRIAGVALWITMVLSFSRASIGFAYAALLRWALAGRAGPRRYAAIAVGVPALGFLALLTRYNLLLDPTHWWSARFVEPDVQGRWINIPSSLQQVASHPSWGCGLDCLPVELEDGYRQDTHLTWLNIAATLGLPALAAFVAVVVSTWRTRRKPTNVALWSGLVGLFFDSLACDVENFRHVWLLLGCLNARPELMPGLTKRPTADHHVASSPT
jgi:hypothetical protein